MRKTGRNSILILIAAVLCRGQDSKPVELVDQLAARIPEPYRTIAKSTVALPAKTQQSWLTVPADDLMIAMIGQLASTPEGIRFLLQRLANEAAPVWRARIIGALSGYWRSHQAEQPIVERYSASDPDPQVSLEALEVLRSIRMTDLENLFETRLAVARDSHDEPALAALVPQQERWFSRLVLSNRTGEDHPIHFHRHTFELTRIGGRPTAGIRKDVVLVHGFEMVEVDVTPGETGLALLHCHQQMHMDQGFKILLNITE